MPPKKKRVVKKSKPKVDFYNQYEPGKVDEPEPESVATEPGQTDRVIRSGRSLRKNAACPDCGSFPTITMIRRGDYELRRCRDCGKRFQPNGSYK